MAHKTEDGKKQFTNKSQARQYDRRNKPSTGARESGSEGMQDMHDQDDPNNQGAPEMTQDSMDSPDGAMMAQEHGPAHKITIQHDPSGTSNVQVDHPDGHSHMTQHGSVDEAHKFANDCAGAM